MKSIVVAAMLVVLGGISAPAAVWDGGEATTNGWSAATNWAGDVAPADADPITFLGTLNTTNVNDLLTTVDLVTFGQGGFSVSGNGLALFGGMVNTGDNAWAIGTTLTISQAFTSDSGTLSLLAPVDLGANTLTVGGDGRLVLGGAVTGGGGLDKAGTGTVVLAVDNSYSGTTLIGAGILQIGNAGASGTLGSGLVTNNGTLYFKRQGPGSSSGYGGAISGTGDLVLELNADGDFFYLSGTSDYTGKTTLRRGVIQIASETSLGATPGALVADSLILDGGKLQGYQGNKTLSATRGITINSGKNGYLYVWTGYDLTVNGPVAGAGRLVKQDGGRLILLGENTYTGGTTVENGTLQIGDGGTSGTLGAGDVGINAGKSLVANRSDALAFTNRITGDGATANSLVMNGAGTLTLAGTGDNSGLVGTVNTGTLVLAKASSGGVHALGAGGVGLIVNSNATARLGGTGQDQLYTQLDVVLNGGSTFDLAGLSEGFDGLTLNAGAVVTNTQPATNVTLFVGENSAGSALAGAIAGNINLQKTGNGTVTVNGPQAYTGWTHLQAGSLTMGADDALPDSTIVIAWGGAGTFSVSGRTDTIRSISVGSDPDTAPVISLGDGGRLTVAGNDIVASKVGTYTYAKWAGRIRGLGSITYSNAAANNGLWDWLNAGNDFTGSVTVARGRLRIRSPSNALDSTLGFATNLIFDGAPVATLGNQQGDASLQVETGANLTLNSSRTITLNAGREGTMYVWGGTICTLDGQVTGGGNLRKEDSGVLLLNNTNNDYSGETKVVFGALRLGANEVLPDTTVVTLGGSSGGPTLDLSAKTETIAGLIDGGVSNGSVSGGGTLRVAGGGDYGYGGTFNGSLLVVAGSGTQTLAGAADNNSGVARVDGGTLVLGKTSSASVHAIGSDSLGLTVNSGGTVRLAGTGGDQIYVNTDVAVNNGGTFDLAGLNEGFDELSGDGSVTSLGAGISELTIGQNNGSSTFGGAIADGAATVRLTKTGGGTLTLGSVNTFSGTTAIQAGTLALTGSASIANSATIQLASTASVLSVTGRTDGAMNLAAGQTLTGVGTVQGILNTVAGSQLAPGGSVGTLVVSNDVNVAGGTYLCEVTGPDATNADLIAAAGTVTITGGALTPVFSGALTGPTDLGNTLWDTNQQWTVMTGGAVSGSLTVDNTAWASRGAFTTAAGGGTLSLVWTAGPPPPSSGGSTSLAARVVSNQFVTVFAVVSGAQYRVQATTNLVNAALWEDLATNVAAGATLQYADPDAPNHRQRSYRLLSP